MRRTVGTFVVLCVLAFTATSTRGQARPAAPADDDAPARAAGPVQNPPPINPRVIDRNARGAGAAGPQPGAGRPGAAATGRAGGSGSLLRAALAAQSDKGKAQLSEVSFFAVPEPEPKTLKKHDLISIIIREESTASSKGTNEFEKEAGFEAAIEEWVKIVPQDFRIEGGGISGPTPQINVNGKREFKGEGKVDRSDKFIARIQAEIVDVKPNGTLVVQARKRIQNDDEQQQFILTGICRAEDVTADNSVLSSQLFDLELEKKSKGDVRTATRRGWIPKLLDVINPF